MTQQHADREKAGDHHRAIVFALELARDRLRSMKMHYDIEDSRPEWAQKEITRAQESVDFLEGLMTQTVAMLDGHLVGFYASQPPGTKFWFSVEDMEEGHEPDTVVPGANDNYVMVLDGPAPEEERSERFVGCHHPAWPDPLDLQDAEGAQRWYNKNVGRYPDIYVDRISSVRTRFLGKKTEDG